MRHCLSVLLVGLFLACTLQAADENATLKANTFKLIRELQHSPLTRDLASQRDVVLDTLSRDSGAINLKDKTLVRLASIRAKLNSAKAKADVGQTMKARRMVREAVRSLFVAEGVTRGLETVHSAAREEALRSAPRGDDFISQAIGDFYTQYIKPLATELTSIYSLIQEVFSSAQDNQGNDFAHTGVAYQFGRGKVVPAAFYNITFWGDLAPQVGAVTTMLGSLGSSRSEGAVETDSQAAKRLSLQIGMSINQERVGGITSDESRIGFLGAGYKLSDNFSVGAGVSAGDGFKGIDPYLGVTVNLLKLF